MNAIDDALLKDGHAGKRWKALVLAGERFAVELPEGADESVWNFARNGCVAHVHAYIRAEMENMAEVAARCLLECKFAFAERNALRIAGCHRDLQARDLGSSRQWTNVVYKNCIVAATHICKAKYLASAKKQVAALKCAQTARNALSEHEVADIEENRSMVWALRELSALMQPLERYIEEKTTAPGDV